MKIVVGILIALFLSLQYRLWIGEGSIAELSRLQDEINKQESINGQLIERNRILAAEVNALRKDDDAIEERARMDLGMIKPGETFFMVVSKAGSEFTR